MRYLGYFLKKHRTSLFFLAFFFAVFALLFFLAGIPVGIAGYGFLLCAAFSLLVYGISFAQFVHEVKTLQRALDGLPQSLDHLPRTEDAQGYLYQEMLRRMRRLYEERESEIRGREEDREEYLTLWAHQIKTPIAAIRLLLPSGEADTQERQEVLDQVFRIEQYVEMVLNYQRLNSTSGDWSLKRQPLDPIVRASIRKYARQFIRKKLSLSYDGTDLTVLTDGKWLGFVIDQILSNALKYTKQGGITVYTEENRLFIRDSGIGIRPEDLPRIFERGYTGYNGHSDKHSTGLGLYLCRQVCEKLGHAISVDSAVGAGTCVCVELESTPIEFER